MILRLLWLGRLPTGSGLAGGATARPFLYTRLNAQLVEGKPVPKPPTTLTSRILQYGETKWQDLGRHPSHSIRGRIYQAGSQLIDRIPMQERMLWRVYAYMAAQPAAGKFAQAPPVEHAPEIDPAQVRRELAAEMEHWVAVHGKWRMIHGMAIVPALLLSVLPFVKLWLAWEIFRTVTHHRALMAAAWMRRWRKGAAATSQGFLANPELTTVLQAPQAIDEELPGLLRRLHK